MLGLHNKMRCTVGAEKLKWNQNLANQAQNHANKCVFSHSNSYSAGIRAGENLATGTDIGMAAWMWYTEYTQQNPATGGSKTGHFTAMVWKQTKELGCGICRNGKGVIVCHYANSAPNMMGQYGANVPRFDGNKDDYKKCKLSVSAAKSNIAKFKQWGILRPISSIVGNLGRWSLGDFIFDEDSVQYAGTLATCVGFGALVVAFAGWRRWQRRSVVVQDEQQLLTVD